MLLPELYPLPDPLDACPGDSYTLDE